MLAVSKVDATRVATVDVVLTLIARDPTPGLPSVGNTLDLLPGASPSVATIGARNLATGRAKAGDSAGQNSGAVTRAQRMKMSRAMSTIDHSG